MHIANVIVTTRAFLASAEAHYGNGHKGTASETLAALAAFVMKELPGMSTEPDGADPAADVIPKTGTAAKETATQVNKSDEKVVDKLLPKPELHSDKPQEPEPPEQTTG